MASKRAATAKRLVKTNALRRGVLGGSPFWRVIYGVLTARRLWSKVSKKGDAPIAFRESIEEGEAWTIVHVPEESRRGRGEGRRYLIGPKRTKPRAPRWVPPALAVAGRRILEVPDPDRINKILGAHVVDETPPSRRERRKLRRLARRTRKEAHRTERAAAKHADKAEAAAPTEKADAGSAADESSTGLTRRELRTAKRDAKEAKRAEKRARKAARQARRSRRRERAARKAERKARKAEREMRKTGRRAERKARRAARRLERKAKRGWRRVKDVDVEDLTPGS